MKLHFLINMKRILPFWSIPNCRKNDILGFTHFVGKTTIRVPNLSEKRHFGAQLITYSRSELHKTCTRAQRRCRKIKPIKAIEQLHTPSLFEKIKGAGELIKLTLEINIPSILK